MLNIPAWSHKPFITKDHLANNQCWALHLDGSYAPK